MTDKQFWMKADQISESHKPIEKKQKQWLHSSKPHTKRT